MGYDETTGGSIALQKGHQPRALYDELPTALILKNDGNHPFVNKINDIFLIFDNKLEDLGTHM